MDQSLPVTSDDFEATWPAYRTMGSENHRHPSFSIPRSPQWPGTTLSTSIRPSLVTAISTNSLISPASQHSPASAAMDIPRPKPRDGYPQAYPQTSSGSLSSAPALDYSTSSSSPTLENSTSPSSDIITMSRAVASSTNSDSTNYGHVDDHQMEWEHTEGDQLTIPKLEPIDEDNFRFEDVQAAPSNATPSNQVLDDDAQPTEDTPTQAKVKRPRGRPRKLGVTPVAANTSKLTKGRSKTGCITCRKRKKKCDEAKPRCMNCEKNAVVCEGYPEKQIWKSGKERAEEELLKNKSLPVITMQPIFSGMETPEDRVFWKHYNDHLSAVFTVEGEHRNGFQDMLVPLATRHHGMMHSILSLASRHLDYDTPYGAKILQRNTKVTVESLQRRSTEHNRKAVKILYEAMGTDGKDDPDPKVALAARYGQMLCLVLESLAEGGASGSHRSHYNAFLYLIQSSPPEDPAFHAFIVELFYYHIFADDLVHLPRHQGPARVEAEDWIPPKPIHPPRLIGVADGLFGYLSQITTIRNRIRTRIAHNYDPRVDYDSLYRASDIESDIVDWTPSWPAGDSRELVTLLYKQMAWLYLKTTICPPASAPISKTTLPSRHGPMGGISRTNSSFSEATTSRGSSPSPKPELMTPMSDQARSPRRPSTAVSKGSADHSINDANDRASPPPIRRPSNHEPGINVAVKECLNLLESFKPSDPAQTLLLIPCVIVGTACYAPAEQERIRNAVGVVRGYTGLRNTCQALDILNEVWRLMDEGEFLRAWDWQAVAYRQGTENLF